MLLFLYLIILQKATFSHGVPTGAATEDPRDETVVDVDVIASPTGDKIKSNAYASSKLLCPYIDQAIVDPNKCKLYAAFTNPTRRLLLVCRIAGGVLRRTYTVKEACDTFRMQHQDRRERVSACYLSEAQRWGLQSLNQVLHSGGPNTYEKHSVSICHTLTAIIIYWVMILLRSNFIPTK